MGNLKLSYIQSGLHWENPDANRIMFSSKIADTDPESDLIVLPEMFSTGFTMAPARVAEPEKEGETVNWMAETARNRNCVITGSLVIESGGQYYNRLVWMRPDGTYEYYDKRHLFRYGGEQEHYQPGKNKLLVDLKGWKVCPLICYDLRFPVWSRNRWKTHKGELQSEYDLLIYVANWPERRSHPWKTLLQARAIENQAYVAGINRIGDDAQAIFHSGDSAVIDFKGELLSTANKGIEYQETIELSYQKLQEFRKAFPAGMDADDFSLA
jgi:omega-amidase